MITNIRVPQPSGAGGVVLATAVGEDIPEDWDATRIGIALQDDDNGRMSVVTS